MTPPSRRRDFASTVDSIRQASRACRAGGPGAFDGFRDLVNYLFCLTVGHEKAGIRLSQATGRHAKSRMLTGGHDPKGQPVVKLMNGHYLQLIVSLYMDPDRRDQYLRTSMSLFQYQLDEAGDDWIFRYEYRREPDPGEPKPVGHLHVRGSLLSGSVLVKKQLLEHVHFPCGRPTIESVIRLLADDFHVPASAPDGLWRPALAESERDFLDVAHKAVHP